MRERLEAVREAERFARCVAERLAPVAAILYGSYARGDFNAWSDIDVLIVTGSTLPENPLKRLDVLDDCLAQAPIVEPLVLTVRELLEKAGKCNPAVVEALGRGVILYMDGQLAGIVEDARRAAEACSAP